MLRDIPEGRISHYTAEETCNQDIGTFQESQVNFKTYAVGKREKVKVKCTLIQALRLCTGRTAHRGSRGIALLFHDHDTRRG